jgi:RNA polymerase sigma-70 factor (ECF subfamily)
MRDDAEIVRAVAKGRTELFAELVDRHSAAVFRLVRAAVRQEADAEDVAQEVFLASYRALPRLRDPARFRAHLLAIATRKVADYIRRRQRPEPQPLREEPAAPALPARSAKLAAVEAVVDRLDARSRLIFALRHHEGLPCRQIARLLEVADGTIYSRLSRIHAAIRKAVEVAER